MTTATPTRPLARATAPGTSGELAGTWSLIRFVLRRDRIRIPAWLVGITGFLAVSAASVPDIYPTAAERQSRAEFVASPVLTTFAGPGYGLDEYTVGAMVANEYLIYGLVAAALMSIFVVIRHTRAEEEAGRTELVRAAVVGRHAAPTAVLTVAGGVNLMLGALVAVALDAGVAELSTVGSWTFGMSVAAGGIVFAAAAAVAAQVTEHARGAVGLACTALAVAFVLRAAGDAGDRTLSWLSPLGWAQSTRAFVDERWWPLLLGLAGAAVLTAAAFALAGRRDVGAGLVRPRPGNPRASDLLVRPVGLALRLHRGSLSAWAVGLLAFGAVFGSLVGEVEAFLDGAPELHGVFGADGAGALLDAFLSTVMLLLALLATGYAISAALRPRSEEVAGRAEPLLATGISRLRWAGSHLTVALLGSAVALLAGALGVGVAAAAQQGEARWITDMFIAGFAHLPAMWLVAAVAVAFYGFLPRAAALSWALLGYAAFVGLIGDALEVPTRARELSPFHHVPELPGGDFAVAPIVVLMAVVVALLVTGLTALRRRGINVT